MLPLLLLSVLVLQYTDAHGLGLDMEPTSEVDVVACNPNRDGDAPDPWCDQTCVKNMRGSYFNLMKSFMADCDVFTSYFAENAVLEQGGVQFVGIDAIRAQCESDKQNWPEVYAEFVDTTYTSASNSSQTGEKLYYIMGTLKHAVQSLPRGEQCSGIRNEVVRATANSAFKFVDVHIIYDPSLVPCDGPNGTAKLEGRKLASQYLQLMNYWKARDCTTYASYFAPDAHLYDNGVVYHNRSEIFAACQADTAAYPSIGFSWDVNYTNGNQGNTLGTRPYGKFGKTNCTAILNQVIIVTFNPDYTVSKLEALFPFAFWKTTCQKKVKTVAYNNDEHKPELSLRSEAPSPSWNIWVAAGIAAWRKAAGFPTQEHQELFASSVDNHMITPFNTSSYYYGIIQAANNNFGLTSNPLFFVYARHTSHIVSAVTHANFPRIFNGNPDYRPKLVVRSGGHSMLAFSTSNDSIIVDMSNMTRTWFNKEKMEMTAEAGNTFHTFYAALKDNGVHTPGGSCNGVALGGYNGGGGYGITSRMYGMGCYNIKEVTLVTANGSVITANKDRHTELLWAQCGGGNMNYGIAVNMTFNVTRRMPLIWNIEYRWNISSAKQVIDTFQRYVPFKAPRNLGLYLEFSQYNDTPPAHLPPVRMGTPQPWSYMIAAIGMWWEDATQPGTLEDAMRAMAPFDAIGGLQYRNYSQQTYENSNSNQFDGIEWAMPYTHKKPYWEFKYSSIINRPLSGDEIQLLIDAYLVDHPKYEMRDENGTVWYCCGSEISFEVYGGAIANGPHWTKRLGGVYNTWSHQVGYFDVFASAYFVSESQKKSTKQWADKFWSTLLQINKSATGPPVYRNYPIQTDKFPAKDFMLPYYQNSAAELQNLKSQWDPSNFFRYAQSIRPKDASQPRHHTGQP